MIVVALVAIILALAARSFTRMIEMQRLRGVQAQFVTDMQFARSEAIARNVVTRVVFGDGTAPRCYTIYTAPLLQDDPCDCTRGVGNACAGLPTHTEVRTVVVPTSSVVTIMPLGTTAVPAETSFGFDPTTGGLLSNPNDEGPAAIGDFRIDVALDTPRRLRILMEGSGRPTVCSPAGTTMPEAACPP